MSGHVRLNVGSGQRRFDPAHGWINVDKTSREGAEADLIVDLEKEPLPFASGSVQIVVLHHVLEHFGCGEAEGLVHECKRVLEPGGSLIVTVPDMRALADRWTGHCNRDVGHGSQAVHRELLDMTASIPSIHTQVYMTCVYGAYQGDEGDRHKWGYDYVSLYRFLTDDCGPWGDVKRFDFREIPGADIAKDWWILGMEAVKAHTIVASKPLTFNLPDHLESAYQAAVESGPEPDRLAKEWWESVKQRTAEITSRNLGVTPFKMEIFIPVLPPLSEQMLRWIESQADTAAGFHPFTQIPDLLPVQALQEGFLRTDQGVDVIGYLHSDLEIHEKGWDERVLREFEDESVGVVGFGGALRHGRPDIYKVPYEPAQLARDGYRSNVTDAEDHGERFEGSCGVAVLDGFALFVRPELLEKAGGWPVDHLVFHCYDYWICLIAHRFGRRVRLAGVKCTHHGGRTSTRDEYQGKLRDMGTSDQGVHEEAHRWIYGEFRDVLPVEVRP